MNMRNMMGSCLLVVLVVPFILYALEAGAAVYEVGPDKTYTRIIDVPTHNLTAGDIVRVYAKSTLYREKFLLHGVGTAAAPIMFIGVPDANGNKPLIDGQNAISATAHGNYYWNEDRQVILVGQDSKHIQIHSLSLPRLQPNDRPYTGKISIAQ
jgi:hypothetical protein